MSEYHLEILHAVLFCDLTRLLIFSADMQGVLLSAKFAISISLMIANESHRCILKKTVQSIGKEPRRTSDRIFSHILKPCRPLVFCFRFER